jgi:biotin synthase-related radical SAM superfamily protein
MTNNKQQTAVKLYTEKQLTRYLLDEGIMELSDLANNLIPHIEIPSDEEIDEKAFQVPYDNTKDFYNLQFIKGAKWMRDKIQGGE